MNTFYMIKKDQLFFYPSSSKRPCGCSKEVQPAYPQYGPDLEKANMYRQKTDELERFAAGIGGRLVKIQITELEETTA